MIRAALGALKLALVTAGAITVDQPAYGPEPPWVEQVAIPKSTKPTGSAAQVLLWTTQGRYLPGDDETFIRSAVRVDAPQGLEQAGNLIQGWDPSSETLTIHHARLLRGTAVIDLLAGGRRFTASARNEPGSRRDRRQGHAFLLATSGIEDMTDQGRPGRRGRP